MVEIIGLLIAIGALLVMLPGLMHWTVLGSEEVKDTAISQQAIIFEKAAEQYLSENSGALLSTATPTVPVVVTTAQLEAGNYLPTNYTSTNIYGQTWELQVLQPTSGVLQAVALTTGGSAIEDEEAARISALIGASGGFIPVDNSGAYPQTSTLTAYGTQGAWTLNLKNYSNATKGQLVDYVSLVDSTGQVTSNNYLYRYAVPGNSDLNTMHTPLIMAAIESKGAACTTTGAIAQDGTGSLLSCQAGIWAAVGDSSWKSPVGTYSALPSTGNSLGDVRLDESTDRAYAWNGASWQALAVDQNGNLDVPSTLTAGAVTTSGNIQSGGNVTAAGNISTNGSISNNAASIASNGEITTNSGTYGLVTNVGGTAEQQAGSIYINDSYHRAGGIQYPWYSQMSSQVYTNTQNISSIENTLNLQGQQILSNTSSINTVVSNLNSNTLCNSNSSYPYASLTNICKTASAAGVNISYIGSYGPVGNVTTTVTGTCYGGNRYYRYTYPCPYTTTSPPNLTETNTSSAPELITLSELMGNSSNSGGSSSGLAGNSSSNQGCSIGGAMGNTVNISVNGTSVGQISDMAPYSNFNYQRNYSWGGTTTFAVPPGATWSAAMTQTSCGELSAQVWSL